MGVSFSTLCGLLFIRRQYRSNGFAGAGRFSRKDAKTLWRIALPIALTSLSANLTTVIDLSSVMNCLKSAVGQGEEKILAMYAGFIPPELRYCRNICTVLIRDWPFLSLIWFLPSRPGSA